MAMPDPLYAKDLLRLTVEDIEKCRYFEIKDPENRTEKHLVHLRVVLSPILRRVNLIRQRDLKAQSQPVDADDLQDKLHRLPSRNSSPSFSSTSSGRSLTLEELEEEDLRAEKEAYDSLVEDGARPSHPINLGFDILDSPGEYKDILWFWSFMRGRRFEFQSQLANWKKFRDYQARAREFYVKRNGFHECELTIRESQQDMTGDWLIAVHPDSQKQNRLENWNEYRAYQYQILKGYKTKVGSAELKMISEQKELEDAESRLSDAIVDREVLFKRAKEALASNKKIADATLRFESAQQTLQAAKVDKGMNTSERAALVRVAQKELCTARKNLDDVSETEEMRRLREGYELAGFRQGVAAAEGRLHSAKLDVRRWEVF